MKSTHCTICGLPTDGHKFIAVTRKDARTLEIEVICFHINGTDERVSRAEAILGSHKCFMDYIGDEIFRIATKA